MTGSIFFNGKVTKPGRDEKNPKMTMDISFSSALIPLKFYERER